MSDADEVAELKYEAAKWKRSHDAIESKLMEMCEESVRLKAEVDEYNKVVSTAHVDLFLENARLKAEVERLRKAGDGMANAIKWLPQSISDRHLDAWNDAKEGKPQS